MARLLSLCFVLLFIASLPVKAGTPPIPKNKKEALHSFEKRLAQENKNKDILKKQSRHIHNDLASTKNKLIKTAATIQQNEDDLKNFEQRIANLEVKKSILEDELKADRSSIAKLILALERIRRTPPEAMLARPDTPYKTAQSAMLMGSIIPSVNRHAEKLGKNLETLSRVTNDLELEKTSLLETSGNLKIQHAKLSTLIEKRTKLFAKTNSDIVARELSIQQISLQAQNLEDLVKRIKENERKEKERQAKEQKKAKYITRSKPNHKIIDSGTSRLPISGIIRVGYKQTDHLGAKSKGITIEGRTGALVITPMNGTVQFTGAFKRYGNIVIIEHANGFHSLIAGLDKINSVIGDHVKSGEPIGILPNSSLIPRPTLYYELRKNGKAVNPAIKFPSLG
ncbi:MAG: hypothetical protein COB14_06935 [Alphaproteobacteria bacterium]|nr:MAG: hypothetical protein COB14_06935 [Alphaproteobacteria bacterium]